MNEALNKLIIEMNKNADFSDKMKNCKSADEAYQLALTVSTGYSKQEFEELMKKISEKKDAVELTEGDLEHVAGGLTGDEWFAIGGFGVSVSTAAASAASAY